MTREAASDGSSPHTTPVTRARTAEKPATRQSTVKLIATGIGKTGTMPRINCTSASATAIPAAAPMALSTRLSVTSSRTTRPRDEPSDARTAISRERPAPRASSMPPTLAQAMSRMRPTTTKSNSMKRETTLTSAGIIRAGSSAMPPT